MDRFCLLGGSQWGFPLQARTVKCGSIFLCRGGNVNTVGLPVADEPNCIYIMAGGGGGGSTYAQPAAAGTGGLWGTTTTPMSRGGDGEGSSSGTGGYMTSHLGDGAGGSVNGTKFIGGVTGWPGNNRPSGGGGCGYYGGGSNKYINGGGGGSSYVNTSVTAVSSAATNDTEGYVTLTIVQ